MYILVYLLFYLFGFFFAFSFLLFCECELCTVLDAFWAATVGGYKQE